MFRQPKQLPGVLQRVRPFRGGFTDHAVAGAFAVEIAAAGDEQMPFPGDAFPFSIMAPVGGVIYFQAHEPGLLPFSEPFQHALHRPADFARMGQDRHRAAAFQQLNRFGGGGSQAGNISGFSLANEVVKGFQGFDFETSTKFWHKVLAAYLGTENENRITEVENKARIIGYTRLIRRSIRRNGLNEPERKKEIDHWKEELIDLIGRTDTLLFEGNELEIDAKKESLPKVTAFIEERMEEAGFTPKAITVVTLAAEEIFVNIASYAYDQDNGKAKIRVEMTGDPVTAVITFIDQGKQFDPMAKEDPDVSLPAEERTVGGLGIFMTKKLVDDMSYEYKDGQNVLKLVKKLS